MESDIKKCDGTEDKRYRKGNRKEAVIEPAQVLPYKDGYMQIVFAQMEINSDWVAVNNTSVRKEESIITKFVANASEQITIHNYCQ